MKFVLLLGALIAAAVVIAARRRNRGQMIANVEPTFESDEKDRDDA